VLDAAQKFEKVFILLGNHEFYRSIVSDVYQKVEEICSKHENLIFLHKKTYEIPNTNVIILGTCLWSFIPPEAIDEVHMYLNDYQRVHIDVDPNYVNKGDDPDRRLRLITPEDTTSWHQDELSWIKEEIKESKERNKKNYSIYSPFPYYKTRVLKPYALG